jgi:alpha-ketoglutarate-dependent taurine dioxygenase
MINTEPIMYPGMEELQENIDAYKEKFFNDGVLVFRNANFDKEEHADFNAFIASKFGWFPAAQNTLQDRTGYTENHSRAIEKGAVGKDEILIKWHQEHPYYQNPIVGSTWNMTKFKTDPDTGKTFFVDMQKLYESLSEANKEFLNKCKANLVVSQQKEVKVSTKVVQPHWHTKEPVIRSRYVPDGVFFLTHFEDRTPSDEEIQKFKILSAFITNEVLNNEDIRIVHRWEQGDVVIPDLFKMAHAVTGGFDSENREFTGIWGFKDEVRPQEDLQYHVMLNEPEGDKK